MKKVNILIATLFFLVSCTNKKIPEQIIIEGQVKNMPEGRIYLTEAHRWEIHLDSTICTNGHFMFKIRTDSTFVPYMAAIHFPDSSSPSKVGGLYFSNYMLGADSAKQASDAFYLEKGNTWIEGDNKKKPYLRVFAGKETDIMYKNKFDFGWIGNSDSIKRLSIISYYKRQIKAYPFSYFLLQSIYECRDQYSEKEIQDILSLFTAEVQRSKLGEQVRTYLANRTDAGDAYPNLFLLNATNERQYIIDTNAKVTMLVFWASWCGPCRMEIPVLKEIQKEYKSKGLNLVSISIDENRENWVKAMQQEKMNWTQCIVDRDKIDLVKQQYNFAAIPLVIFTDNTGKEIIKFIGYEEGQKKVYEAVINKVMHFN